MIKFLGPRDLLSKQTHKLSTSSNTVSNQSQIRNTSGAGISVPSLKTPFLNEGEMDIVNSGGFTDGNYQKVKPISLKK